MLRLLYILLFYAGSVSAQNASGLAILKEISLQLSKTSNYHYAVNVQSFSVSNPNTASYNANCISLKNNTSFYVQAMGKTTIITDKYSLLADVKQRLIMYREFDNKPNSLKPLQDPGSMVSIDTLLKMSAIKVSVLNNDENGAALKVTNIGGGLSDMKIYFDKKLNYIKRLEYVYDLESQKETGNLRVVVNYKPLKASKAEIENIFSLKNYLSKSKGSWLPAKKYEGYKVVDQTNLGF